MILKRSLFLKSINTLVKYEIIKITFIAYLIKIMSNTVNVVVPDSAAPRKVVICYDESQAGRQALEWINSHSVLLPTDNIYIVTCINEDVAKIEGPSGWQTVAIGGIDCAADYRHTIAQLESQGREHLAEAVHAMQDLGLVIYCFVGKGRGLGY